MAASIRTTSKNSSARRLWFNVAPTETALEVRDVGLNTKTLDLRYTLSQSKAGDSTNQFAAGSGHVVYEHPNGTFTKESFEVTNARKVVIASVEVRFRAEDYFNSDNPTVKSVALPTNAFSVATDAEALERFRVNAVDFFGYGSVSVPENYYSSYYSESVRQVGAFHVRYNIPLRISKTISKPSHIYAGYSSITVTATVEAQCGGNVESVSLKCGGSTIPLTLNTSTGKYETTFTPTEVGTLSVKLSATDSRSVTTTSAFGTITVLEYVAPDAAFTATRIASNSLDADDEGTRALIAATFDYTSADFTLKEPTVQVQRVGGNDKADATVTWYTDSACTTAVDWTDFNPASGTTLYAIVTGYGNNAQLDPIYSQTIFITPEDSRMTGTAKTQIIPATFYTIDFLAGGRGVAIGKAATEEGFEVAMPSVFEDDFFLDLPEYQASGTDDKALYDAIDTLGWTNDVLV